MLEFLKRIFSRKRKHEFTDEEYQQHYELKQACIESILGPIHQFVGHAVIPFQVGGAVDMYYFPNAIPGTAFVTMELIEPDGTGPVPSTIGTYEFVAFTKHPISRQSAWEDPTSPFNLIERRFCGIFTTLGNYSFHAKLKPRDTCETPGEDGHAENHLIFDHYTKEGVDFRINGKRHGLLLCIEIFKSECDFARANGGVNLIARLKDKGYYPYSDLDRDPVA